LIAVREDDRRNRSRERRSRRRRTGFGDADFTQSGRRRACAPGSRASETRTERTAIEANLSTSSSPSLPVPSLSGRELASQAGARPRRQQTEVLPPGLVEVRERAGVGILRETEGMRANGSSSSTLVRGTCTGARTRTSTAYRARSRERGRNRRRHVVDARAWTDRPLDFERLDVYRCAIDFLVHVPRPPCSSSRTVDLRPLNLKETPK
jgi:hypothetical protein